MEEPINIHLSIEGQPITLLIRRETTAHSLHTGRELRELHGWVSTADAERHAWLSRALQAAAGEVVRAADEEGEFAGKWQVSWNSYAESAGVHTYTLILREAEELSLEALVLDGREFYPYEFREEVGSDGGLTIWAKLVGQEADVLELRTLMAGRGVFPVVRRGIHEEPREMRLGVAEWSDYEDRVKYRLVLVDRVMDDTLRSELIRIEERNNQAALAYYANFAEQLAELLVAKGVLMPGEVDAVRETARGELGVARHEFWRVADVDAL